MDCRAMASTINEVLAYLQAHQGKLPSRKDTNLKVRQLHYQFMKARDQLKALAGLNDVEILLKRRKRAAPVVQQRVGLT